jgi:hypothetical protein
MSVPYRLANGAGNPPDATKFMADYDWLEAMAIGNLLENPGLENWDVGSTFTSPLTDNALANSWYSVQSGGTPATYTVAVEQTIVDGGTNSAKITISVAGSADSIAGMKQLVPYPTRTRSLTLLFGMRVRSANASKVRIKISDGTSTGYSSYHTGGGSFELLQATIAVAAAATSVVVSVEVTSDFTGAVYCDNAYVYVVPSSMTTAARALLTYASTGDRSISIPTNPTLRNRIINGGMRIDQRNAGATIAASGMSCDRHEWAATTGGAFTIGQSTTTPPTGFTHLTRVTCTSADASIAAADRLYMRHKIEGSMMRDFIFGSTAAKAVTLSFWVRSTLVGIYTGSLSNGTRSYPFEYTISAASTWEKKVITLSGDTTGTWATDTSAGLIVTLALMIGSNFYGGSTGAWNASDYRGTSNQVNFMSSSTSRTWDLTGLQLEIGSFPTDFDYRTDPAELALCQRYYEKTFNLSVAAAQNSNSGLGPLLYRAMVAGTAGANGQAWKFAVNKRTTPTMTYFNPRAANAKWRNESDGADSGTAATQYAGESMVFVENPQVAGDGVGEFLIVHAQADAEL